MENSNIKKQAKSDIFKELHPIISFYIQKGAKPASLKKYYKNNKIFNDILDDIKNKGINLVKDETEYKSLVKEILNDILDDFIAKDKDVEYKNKQESKMKHIKEFNSYNEGFMETAMWVIIGWAFYKFMKGLIQSKFASKEELLNKASRDAIDELLIGLKDKKSISVSDFADRYFIRVNLYDNEYDIRLLKDQKILLLDGGILTKQITIPLTNEEFENFISLIKKQA